MSTAVQNEDGDYDIDAAVVFDKNVLRDKGACYKKLRAKMQLKRKTKQFNAEPEVKQAVLELNTQMDIILILLFTDGIMILKMSAGL